MFKKSRRKIVAAIMSVLVLLLVGTLGVIYTCSYFQMVIQNREMLKAHVYMYAPPQAMEGLMPPNMPPPGDGNWGFDPGFTESPMFQLSIFYTVALSYDGKVLETRNNSPMVHTDEDLEDLAQNVINSGKETGTVDNLMFFKADKDGYILVAFMDNTVVNENAVTLLRYTLIFGGIALALFFFLSVFLARKIVGPLEESYQKQKQFISDAGHELKTPVAVVSANAELLSRDIGENPWLANIQYENERMGMLVCQLLDLARTENAAPQMDHINFSRLAEGEALPFESIAFEKGLVMSSNIAKGVMVNGNSTQLKQIVSVLLDNAIRHSTEQGGIYLSLKKEHGLAQLSVLNKGDEIPREHREQIFERFYRADPVRNGEDKHYGLGLAIAKAAVLAHKGHIEVQCYNGFVEFQVQIPAL